MANLDAIVLRKSGGIVQDQHILQFPVCTLPPELISHVLSFLVPSAKEMQNSKHQPVTFSRLYWRLLTDDQRRLVTEDRPLKIIAKAARVSVIVKIGKLYGESVRIQRAFCKGHFSKDIAQEMDTQKNYIEELFLKHMWLFTRYHSLVLRRDPIYLHFIEQADSILNGQGSFQQKRLAVLQLRNDRSSTDSLQLPFFWPDAVQYFAYERDETFLPFLYFGADPNAVIDLSETPLLFHVKKVKVMQEFIRRGANVNARAHNGRTPLHSSNNPKIIKILLSNGASPNALDDYGQTPLDIHASPREGIDEQRTIAANLIREAGGKHSTPAERALAHRRIIIRNGKLLGMQFFMGFALGHELGKLPLTLPIACGIIFPLAAVPPLFYFMDDPKRGHPLPMFLGTVIGFCSSFPFKKLV